MWDMIGVCALNTLLTSSVMNYTDASAAIGMKYDIKVTRRNLPSGKRLFFIRKYHSYY